MNTKKHLSHRTDEITVRVAATIEDYETAFRIAYDVYYSKGFTKFSAAGMRASSYQLNPLSLILIGYLGDTPVATLSVYDGNEGVLPSSSGWPDELHKQGRLHEGMMELGTLMILPAYSRAGSSRICLAMFRAAWIYAWVIKEAGAFCVFVQAHHKRFYEQVLSFSAFGSARHYEWNGLNIGNVVPLIMDLTGAEDDFKRRFNRFGNSSRNLYYFFTIDKREEITRNLRNGLFRRDCLEWKMLRERFASLLVSKVA